MKSEKEVQLVHDSPLLSSPLSLLHAMLLLLSGSLYPTPLVCKSETPKLPTVVTKTVLQ